MTVKDKLTKKVLNTNSVWLIKYMSKNPKRYILDFKEEEPLKKTTSKEKEVEENGLCK